MSKLFDAVMMADTGFNVALPAYPRIALHQQFEPIPVTMGIGRRYRVSLTVEAYAVVSDMRPYDRAISLGREALMRALYSEFYPALQEIRVALLNEDTVSADKLTDDLLQRMRGEKS